MTESANKAWFSYNSLVQQQNWKYVIQYSTQLTHIFNFASFEWLKPKILIDKVLFIKIPRTSASTLHLQPLIVPDDFMSIENIYEKIAIGLFTMYNF